MKRLHLLHIGFPKTGTSWLWNQLADQSWFNNPLEKENTALVFGQTIEDYIASYDEFEITGNFNVSNFALDRYLIDELSEISTIKVSLSLRNPYEFFWSLFNFLPNENFPNFNDSTMNLLDQLWIADQVKIIDRWKSKFKDRFKVYFYDDLKLNPLLYLQNYLKDHGLENMPLTPYVDQKINVTSYSRTNSKLLSSCVCDVIDKRILELQKHLDRDIQHWMASRAEFESSV